MKDSSISIVKGVGILLMVLAHCGCPRYLESCICMFHMPLFFMASGWCFKTKNLDSFYLYIKKKVKGLYFPYIKWCLPFLLLHNLFLKLHIYSEVYGYFDSTYHYRDLYHTLGKAVLMLLTMNGEEFLVGGFWFLRQLFWASLLTFVIIKYIKRIHLASLLLIVLAYFAKRFSLQIPYFQIGHLTLLGTGFMLAGFFLKDKWSYIEKYYLQVLLIAIASILFFAYYTPTSMFGDHTRLLPLVISSVLGFTTIKLLANRIGKVGYFNKWGGVCWR